MKDGSNSHLKIKYPSDVSKLIKTFNNSKNNALGLLKNYKGEYCNNPEDSLSHPPKQIFSWPHKVPEKDTLEWHRVKNSKLDNTFTTKKVKAAFHSDGLL